MAEKVVKIALVTRGFSRSWGGAERVSVALAKSLSGGGCEVTVFTERIDEAEDTEGLKVVKVQGGGLKGTLRHLSFQKKIKTLLSQENFDVVFGLCQFFPQDIYRASGGVHAHWMRLQYPNAFVRTLKYILSPVHLVMVWLESKIISALGADKSRFVIVNSKLVKGHVLRYFKVDQDKVRVIYNGIDRELFSPAVKKERPSLRRELGIGDEKVVGLYVSNNWKRKGLKTIIRGMKGRDENMVIIVVGRGKKERFLRLARSEGLRDSSLIFAGVRTDVERFYGGSDFFVLPTQYDPCSNATLEAMATGLPVITTDSNGASEFIEEGESGFILKDSEDSKTLGLYLDRLQDSTLRATMGERATKAVSELSWERTMEETFSLCREVLDKKAL
ncbi:MAG: glycosyltransferase family 4 protein [Deltaproteobacteria bacterium]|nr:glycosyltransferase family 4 protein [Deltaproteobacteria bacterium]